MKTLQERSLILRAKLLGLQSVHSFARKNEKERKPFDDEQEGA